MKEKYALSDEKWADIRKILHFLMKNNQKVSNIIMLQRTVVVHHKLNCSPIQKATRQMQMRDIRYFFKRFLNYIKRKTILVLFIEEISYCRWLRQWQGRAWRKRTLQKIMCYNYIKYTPTSINWNWESFDSSSEIIWHLQLIHCYFALLYMKCNLKISVILEIL